MSVDRSIPVVEAFLSKVIPVREFIVTYVAYLPPFLSLLSSSSSLSTSVPRTSVCPPPTPLPPYPPPSTTANTVATHEGQRVLLNLECDVHATSIPHLKALCLLGLVPALKENAIPSSQIQALLPPPPPPPGGTATAPASGAKEELALVGLVKTVRLENTKSGNTLDESSTGASLFATRITEGAQLMLQWGAPPATGKALVKFYVRVGESDRSTVAVAMSRSYDSAVSVGLSAVHKFEIESCKYV